MVKSDLKIVWDVEAKNYLRVAIQFIKQDSPQNAEKVKSEIAEAVSELAHYPTRYPADKYRNDNDGSYRAFELYKYRISYYISDTEIRIVRIRHTAQNPKAY